MTNVVYDGFGLPPFPTFSTAIERHLAKVGN